MRFSQKAQTLYNPIPAILELIPYSETIMDSSIYDNMRVVLAPSIDFPSDSVICLLLTNLSDAGLIDLTVLKFPSLLGNVLTIKRKM